MSIYWNPWHGCHKYSEGCLHCYVYRIDSKYQRLSSEIKKNSTFQLPIEKNKKGYKIKSGELVYTCFTSDFLLEDADDWRIEAWKMMKERSDLKFIFITKRIERLENILPSDWGQGYDNVSIGCTCENNKRAKERLPIFLNLPIKHRFIVCEPLLDEIDLNGYIDDGIEYVTVGGESGAEARICNFQWVLVLRDACISAGVPFKFRQTGAKFRKDGRVYNIPRRLQFIQAKKAAIDTVDSYYGNIESNNRPLLDDTNNNYNIYNNYNNSDN